MSDERYRIDAGSRARFRGTPPRGLVLTFFGPGCWMWQTNDADGEVEYEGVAAEVAVRGGLWQEAEAPDER